MKVEEGKIYSCGKPMFRKVISINGNHLKYSKCYEIKGGIYIIGDQKFFLNRVLIRTFEKWAKFTVLPKAIKATESPSEAAAEEEVYGNDCKGGQCL